MVKNNDCPNIFKNILYDDTTCDVYSELHKQKVVPAFKLGLDSDALYSESLAKKKIKLMPKSKFLKSGNILRIIKPTY